MNWTRLLDVPSADPDDARRRKLLSIMLVGIAVLSFLVLIAGIVAGFAGLDPNQLRLLYVGSLAMVFGVAGLFWLNRYRSGLWASWLFILLLIVAVAFSDNPQEVARGRSLFFLIIPILMASVLVRPWAGFIVAGLVGLLIAGIEVWALQSVPNLPATFGFLAVAFVSWLAARSLEQALRDLRAINRELDQRVEDRTRQLAKTLSENQAILESIADGVIVFDTKGKAVVANPAITRLLGKSDAQIIEQHIGTLMEGYVHAEDQETLEDLFQRSVSVPAFKIEWGDKTLSVSSAQVSESGRTTGTVAVFRDFTREAELERMKSAFVSMVSHELRTPLNGILGYAEMLYEGVYGELDARQHEVMQRILANTSRQLNLVNDLLDRAQIEAGTLSLNYAEVRPADLLRDMHSTMVVLSDVKGLELACHIDDDVPETVQGDSQRLLQILINLVNNAIKFTDQGQVATSIYRPDHDHWAVQVRDTGPGIPPEAQGYIFEPFRRVDDSATRRHSGAGLGLSIVKQLATLMGGQVTLTSHVGKGSTFTVSLPILPPMQKETI